MHVLVQKPGTAEAQTKHRRAEGYDEWRKQNRNTKDEFQKDFDFNLDSEATSCMVAKL